MSRGRKGGPRDPANLAITFRVPTFRAPSSEAIDSVDLGGPAPITTTSAEKLKRTLPMKKRWLETQR